MSFGQRPVDFWHGRAPEGEGLRADGFGDVEGTGVAGEEEGSGLEEGGEFEEAGLTGDGERAASGSVLRERLLGFFDVGRVAFCTGEDDLDVFGHGGEGFTEIGGRPVLVRPGRADADHENRSRGVDGVRGPEFCCKVR